MKQALLKVPKLDVSVFQIALFGLATPSNDWKCHIGVDRKLEMFVGAGNAEIGLR